MFRPNWRSSLNDPYFSYRDPHYPYCRQNRDHSRRQNTQFIDPHYPYGRQNRDPYRYNTRFNQPQHYERRNRQNFWFNEPQHYERRNRQNIPPERINSQSLFNKSRHQRNRDSRPNRNIFGEKQRCSDTITQQQYIKALKEARVQKILRSIVKIQRCWRNYVKRKRLMNAKFNRNSYAIHEIDETPTIPKHRILPDSCPYVLQEIK